jgi:hypothetical protein
MLREDAFTKLHLPWKTSVGVGARASACACERVALLIQYATRVRNVICGLRLHQIYRHYLINGTIFRKKLLNIKYMFGFSLRLLFETFLIMTGIQRDIVINVFMQSPRYSCQI